ncbi:spermidine synthase [Cryptosporangium aurantiacum]|uniref:spermidine synthase n=1 Tax=Cryptosporangium aurantiacum TaxID=134849 RepID=UPI001C4A0CC8|nr:fused MFS/spermidine synthase [Cryptosporangium aurantiacum]
MEIVQDLDADDGWMLLLDGVPNSYLNLADPTHLEFEYQQWMARTVDLHRPDEEQPLYLVHIGGGACAFPRYVAASRPGSRQLVAEYNAELIALIRTVFGIRTGPGLRIRAGDGRDVLAGQHSASADVVVRDAFVGPVVPPHLTTTEFITDVTRVLRPGGLYLANVTDGPPLSLARAEVATARATFPHVALVSESPVLKGRRYGNLMLAASSAPLPTTDLARLLARSVAPTRVLEGADLERFAAGAVVTTDDAPLVPPAPPPHLIR